MFQPSSSGQVPDANGRRQLHPAPGKQTGDAVEGQQATVEVESAPVQENGAATSRETSTSTQRPVVITELLDTEKLRIATGIPSCELLHAITERCQKHQGANVDMMESIILVLMKLKLNHPSTSFKSPYEKTTMWWSNTFFKTLLILSTVLSDAIYWPEKEQYWLTCQSALKATVILVWPWTVLKFTWKGKRSSLSAGWRHTHTTREATLKFMTDVSPDGLVTHVGSVYRVRVSDKDIFEKSRLVDTLELYIDAVMADKGFLIDSILEERCITSHRKALLCIGRGESDWKT